MSETKKLLDLLHEALEMSMVLENKSKEFIKISGKVYNAFSALEKLYLTGEKKKHDNVRFKQV